MAFSRIVQRYDVLLYQEAARIVLYCEENYKLHLGFHGMDTDKIDSTNNYKDTAKTGMAFYKMSHYQRYIDLIRNEKPIRVNFRTEDTPPTFIVYCADEPPGEGEI